MDEEKIFKQYCKDYEFTPSILPPQDRIIVIGDLHGDFKMTIECLKIAKVIDDNLNWIGKNTVVVQIGDQVDRCRPTKTMVCTNPHTTLDDENSDILIMELFTVLHKEAIKNDPPGGVYSLLGNHEIMNAQGVMRYVSYKGLIDFDDEDPKTLARGYMQRKKHFKPGGKYAKFMACTRTSALIIGSFLFVHAGIIPEFTKRLNIKSREDLIHVNSAVRKWLLGLSNDDQLKDIIDSVPHSLFWDRIMGRIPKDLKTNESKKCTDVLEPTLNLFKVGHMIVGHTPQFILNKSGINSTCNNKLIRVDAGNSKAFNQFDKEYVKIGKMSDMRQAQVLEILNDNKMRVLKSKF